MENDLKSLEAKIYCDHNYIIPVLSKVNKQWYLEYICKKCGSKSKGFPVTVDFETDFEIQKELELMKDDLP